MAHGKAPGTTTKGGVTSTMSNAMKASTTQSSNSMKGPFDKPHSTGGGGIPVKMYDTSIGTPKVPTASVLEKGKGTGPILGAQGGQKRPGTK